MAEYYYDLGPFISYMWAIIATPIFGIAGVFILAIARKKGILKTKRWPKALAIVLFLIAAVPILYVASRFVLSEIRFVPESSVLKLMVEKEEENL